MLARQNGSQVVPAQWKDSSALLRSLPLKRQAAIINELVNAHRYIDDQSNWGRDDYWQTPGEFYRSGGGDCEDFAITKYEWLRTLGVPEKNLRLSVVYDAVRDLPHTILILKTGHENLVLDNQEKTIQRAENLTRYEPLYSINRQAWYLNEPKSSVIQTALKSKNRKEGKLRGAAAGT